MCKCEFEIFGKNKRKINKKFCTRFCSSKFNGLANKNRKLSEQTKKKISKSMTGENNPFFGKKHSEDTLKEMSDKRKGITWEERLGEEKSNNLKDKFSAMFSGSNNPFYGKKHSNQSKNLISQNHRDSSGELNPMFGKGFLIQGENNPAWQGGISFEEYGLEFNHELKTKIRLRDKFVCFVCKSNGHIVHHIDYEKKNNDETNLITLCSSCHGKTNFNRDNWIRFFKDKNE